MLRPIQKLKRVTEATVPPGRVVQGVLRRPNPASLKAENSLR